MDRVDRVDGAEWSGVRIRFVEHSRTIEMLKIKLNVSRTEIRIRTNIMLEIDRYACY